LSSAFWVKWCALRLKVLEGVVMGDELKTEASRINGFLYSLLALGFILAPVNSWAPGGLRTGGNQVFPLSLPTAVTVPRDALAGSARTSWEVSPASAGLCFCRAITGNALIHTDAVGLYTADSGVRVVDGVYGSPVAYNTSSPSVGFAVAGRFHFNASAYTSELNSLQSAVALDSRSGVKEVGV